MAEASSSETAQNPLSFYSNLIHLYPHQIDNFYHSVETFAKGNKFKIDYSPTGSGKTYATLAVAQAFGLNVFVVSPVTLQQKWISVAHQYGIYIRTMSYETLRGTGSGYLSHGLLYKEGKNYIPTEGLVELLEQGFLVVFDECQKLKNDSLNTRAATAVACQVQQSSNSFMMLISATPFDKVEMCANVMSVLGFDIKGSIITHNNMTPKKSEISPNLLAWLKSENCPTVQKNIDGLRKKEFQHILYLCYMKTVKSKYAFSMSSFMTEFDVKFYNGYFNFGEHEKTLVEIYQDLVKTIDANRAKKEKIDMEKLSNSLVEIEELKTYIIEKLMKHVLEHTNNSIIVGLHYIQNITYLADAFKEYQPAILTGNAKLTKQNMRHQIIERFQSGQTRIIICTIQVGGVGIDLHDTVGDRPRVVMTSADYRAIDLAQMLGRVRRVGMKSPAMGFLVYCNALDEKSIWESLIAKGKTLWEITKTDIYIDGQTVKFFNDFPIFYESKGNMIPPMPDAKTHHIDSQSVSISELCEY